jgi:protocatechuate 3,4-dioxygenase beta subunit
MNNNDEAFVMNEMEKQFQRIADGLVKNDQPDGDYARQLRQRTLAACRQASSHNVSPGKIRPVWRKIMIRTAAAAMILTGAFLTIHSIDNTSPDNAGKAQNTQPNIQNDFSPAQLNLARELKLAAELYEARDIQGLAGLLNTGSAETKLAVINYLKKLGTDEALKVLKDYEGQSTDPNAVSAIQKAVAPTKLSENPTGDSVTSKETPNTAEPNAVAQKKLLTPMEPNLVQVKSQDVDNDKEGFLGIKVIDSSSGKPIEGATLTLNDWTRGSKKVEQLTNIFGRTVFDIHDRKNITNMVNIHVKGFVPKRLFWMVERGIEIPLQYNVSMTPGATVGGIVKTKEGQPIEGVKVGLRTSYTPEVIEFDYLDSRQATVTTDKDGRWIFKEFPKNISECYIELEHPEYVNTNQYAINPPVEQLLSQNCTLYMQKGLHISGRVTNQAGEPVAEAVIYEGHSKYSQENKVKTDVDGKYVFERCSPGTMYLTIVAKGYAQDVKSFKLDPSVDNADFVLEPGRTLTVRVVDTYGVGIKDAKVEGRYWRTNEYDQPLETFRGEAKTGSDGRSVLEDLPADEVGYDISAKNYASLRRHPLTPSPQEQVITLWPKGKLKGKVYDAQTGQLIEKFSFTEGIQWQGQKEPTWQTQSKKTAGNGNYELPFGYHTEGYAVKIEAEGYLPYQSQTFYNEGKEIALDVTLSKGAGLSGVVLGTDGTPAKNTDIAVALPSTGARIQNCRFYKDSLRTFAQTDPNGRFTFPPQKESYILVALNEDGVGEISEQEFLASGVIQLQKWGRVEGTVYSGLKPLAEQEIGINPDSGFARQPQDINIRYQYNVFSDPNGRFVFEKVRPGKATVHKLVPINDSSKRWTNQTPIEILPGQTVTVKIGGGGRKVTGRLVCPNVAAIDFQKSDFTIYPPAEEIDFSQLPKITVPENLLLLSMEELQALSQRMQSEMAPAIEKLSRNYHSINSAALIDAKGKFTINDIAAGSYRVEAKFKKPDSKPTEYGNYIARASFEITVPEAAKQEDYDTVIDVGQFTVEMMTPGLEIGKSLPEIELMDLNGKPVSLDKFRGKYLVLDLGTFMSMPEKRDAAIEVLKTLYNAHKQAQQFEIVSLSISGGMGGMDIIDKASLLKAYRYYAEQKGIPWLICTELTDMAKSPTLNPFEKFSYNGRTAQYILLDPQGVIVAIPKDEDQLTQTVNQLLQPQ